MKLHFFLTQLSLRHRPWSHRLGEKCIPEDDDKNHLPCSESMVEPWISGCYLQNTVNSAFPCTVVIPVFFKMEKALVRGDQYGKILPKLKNFLREVLTLKSVSAPDKNVTVSGKLCSASVPFSGIWSTVQECTSYTKKHKTYAIYKHLK